jgi:ABC-type multidrug transport system fused ATPase/permease subunit
MIKSIRKKWESTTLFNALHILDSYDRKKLFLVTVLQSTLAFLDLAGVAAVGLVGALAVKGVQSATPGTRVNSVLEFLGIQNFTIQRQVAILGLFAACLFIFRTVLSVIISRRVLFFLSRRAAKIAGNLTAKLLSQPLLKLQETSNQETLYALTVGVSKITLDIIGSTVVIVADISLIIIIISGLFIVDKVIAFLTVIFFGLIGFLLYKNMSVRANSLGQENAKISVASNEKILEVLISYREIIVKNRRDFYTNQIAKSRLDLANIVAEVSFMPNISKYVIESGIIIGAVIISAAQFLLQDASRAVATLAVFMAAASRLAPAVLRIQSTSISARNASGSASPTLKLINSLENLPLKFKPAQPFCSDYINFIPTVDLMDVTFTYPDKSHAVLGQVNLSIKTGEIVAIVGPSGAGKTTMADIILGIISPDKGWVKISGNEPLVAIDKWPGAIAYVPQDVMVSNCSIRENIGLGYPSEEIDDSLVLQALKVAHLDKFIQSLPEGLQTNVGDRGTKLSGGQRQRLGIARAVFTKPKLLVLDEATSSLDGQSEADISDSINDMRGEITVILIAHRLSTVKNADKVVYLEGGKIVSVGTFEEVRKNVPNFEKQASLMGL